MGNATHFAVVSTDERVCIEASQSLEVPTWKLRLIDESSRLQKEIQRHRDFLIHHEAGIIAEQGTTMWTVMRAQLHAMQTYNDCLIARIGESNTH